MKKIIVTTFICAVFCLFSMDTIAQSANQKDNLFAANFQELITYVQQQGSMTADEKQKMEMKLNHIIEEAKLATEDQVEFRTRLEKALNEK